MDSFGQAGGTFASKLSIGALFLCAGSSTAFMLVRTPEGLDTFGQVGIPLRASPMVWLCACVLIFIKPRFGYALGLAASILALPWFVWTESVQDESSWIFLNLAADLTSSQAYLIFVKLKLLSIALTVVASFCAALRLLPWQWDFKKSPLSQRTWPALAGSLSVLAVWLVHSATPYRVPIIADGVAAEFRILHVEKRGLHLRETGMWVGRDGAAWVWRTDRRLFQYRFPERVGRLSLAEISPQILGQSRAFVKSTTLLPLKTPPAKVLRAWNADGWYVVVKDSRLWAFTSNHGNPPPEVTDLFHKLETLPTTEERSMTVRDICLGFCYGPVAALGFQYSNQSCFVLARGATACR
jgi:hypothetical protein